MKTPSPTTSRPTRRRPRETGGALAPASNTRGAEPDAETPAWRLALELDRQRKPLAGSHPALADAVGRGADLRIATDFHHEEHIAPFGSEDARDPRNKGLIEEASDFRVVYRLGGYVAGFMTLRQPVEPTVGFNGSRPRMSFFLYDMEGRQGGATLLLDGSAVAAPGVTTTEPARPEMPKMSATDWFDVGTAAPSHNFIYEMEGYRYFVRDDWTELLAHGPDGSVTDGSLADLAEAHRKGREIKVAISGLCHGLGGTAAHEVFSLAGSSFYHTGRRYLEALTHPLVRIRAEVPLRYGSQNWDIAWVYMRTDGKAVVRRLDPFSRKFSDSTGAFACRWFVR